MNENGNGEGGNNNRGNNSNNDKQYNQEKTSSSNNSTNSANSSNSSNSYARHDGWKRVDQNQYSNDNGRQGWSNDNQARYNDKQNRYNERQTRYNDRDARKYERQSRKYKNLNRNHSQDGFHGIGDLLSYLIGMSFEITFKSIELVFEIISGIFTPFKQNGSARMYSKNNYSNMNNSKAQNDNFQNKKTSSESIHTETAHTETARSETARSETAHGEPVRSEKAQSNKKEVDEMGKKKDIPETENKLVAFKKDVLLCLFLLMIIPLIIFIAMKKIMFAGIIVAIGISLMVTFNIIISGIISFKENSEKKKERMAEIEVEKNVADETDADKATEAAFDKIFEIRKDMIQLPEGVVKEKIESICTIADKIIGEVRSNPEVYPQSKRFFYYHIESFTEIFNKYMKLLNYREDSAETGRTLFETEKAFGNIEEIFRDFLSKTLEKDLINLKAEINVMKNSQ